MLQAAIKIGFCVFWAVVAISTAPLAAPIHDAAIEGDVAEIEQLLKDGADVNSPDPAGTPLHWALFGNQAAAVKVLLNRGADANSKGAQGTALEVAALYGNVEICKLLLDHGANPNEVGKTTPLAVAARERKFEVVSLLVNRGANPNAASPTGISPLHEAAKSGDLKSLKILVENGANVNALTQSGWPAIHYAVLHRKADVAAYLKEHGAWGLHNLSRESFTDPKDMLPSDWTDPQQIKRTWDRAIVYVPAGLNRSRRLTIEGLISEFGKTDKRYPTAIYLHGCAGMWSGSHQRMQFLANIGFIAIGPASMARTKYPQSCDASMHEGGMYRPTVNMRKADAGYAIEQAKSLPFVDADNMLLIGLSEGGITAATFTAGNERQTVNARVVEGWTCNTDWFELRGIKAPKSEPVLTLVGEKDPWFQNIWTKGECTSFLDKGNGSKSIVYREGTLARSHELLGFIEVQNEVLNFVKAHIDLP